MDVESSTTPIKEKNPPSQSKMDPLGRSRRRRNICLITAAAIIALVIALVIIGVTVFRARRPVTTVNSVSLENFHLSLNVLQISAQINVTLLAGISVKNPNKVGMKYTNSSAIVQYRGIVVGEAPIPAGSISAGETLPMNITIDIMADRLLTNSKFYTDVFNGTLPISTYTRISGKVKILLFKIHVVSYTTCNLTISISDRKISDYDCTYKTKL
ncbi:hypothetical protein Nepgr_011909 [Nepenthes gracilis]|uniref:Late embryogenesis abundant protein LEA-2 subgroup domain-containing protein n=1 Tax=Nepenthes gracilis TaxID=150966 RepID=A0AAD3SEX0_NEPGR|nr:hypothetical protein Nepgr_011909 [Nepenthes gracilis]